MPKILHISTYDTGGGSIAAVRLHEGLLHLGIDSSILFLHRTNQNIQNSYLYSFQSAPKSFTQKIIKRIQKKFRITEDFRTSQNNKLRGRSDKHEIFTFEGTPFDITTQDVYKEADIIHLHWTSGFLDTSFFQKNKKPIVWTLHDMNPFTGGCHYHDKCEAFLKECNKCPQLQGTVNDFNSKENFELKSHAYKNTRIHLVCLSTWMERLVKKSRLLGDKKTSLIRNSLNTEIFKPLDKTWARKLFSLNQEKITIMFVANDISSHRKGFNLLHEALESVLVESFQLVYVGNKPIETEFIHDTIYLGSINNEYLMSVICNCADFFVLPSLEDNLPNVMLESLACGVPVLSFEEGGMMDIIENDFNGLLIKEKTGKALAEGLLSMKEKLGNFDKLNIANNAKNLFSPEKQVKFISSLYQEILNEDKHA